MVLVSFPSDVLWGTYASFYGLVLLICFLVLLFKSDNQ